MKIYTKKGDEGLTSLIGGDRVSKNHLRIEAYGTVDELNSFIGVVKDQLNSETDRNLLKEIQDDLFVIGSHLASASNSKMKLPVIVEDDVLKLEQAIDQMNESLEELKSFVLPGGNPISSFCHVARCVCRRAERRVVEISQTENVDPLIIKYLNRLSDFLFVLARKILKDFHGEEIKWAPRQS